MATISLPGNTGIVPPWMAQSNEPKGPRNPGTVPPAQQGGEYHTFPYPGEYHTFPFPDNAPQTGASLLAR